MPRLVGGEVHSRKFDHGGLMKIKSLMIPDPVTITEKASVREAIEVMKSNSIRHLPVVGKGNVLKGFVTMADLKVGLIPSMVAGLSLADLMIRNPISVDPNSDVEVAAQLIYKHKIGGMPVVKKGKLVGIITETDLLRAFIGMMGILNASSRVDVVLGSKRGSLKNALEIIEDHGGEVVNIGIANPRSRKRAYFFRLTPCDTAAIKKALEKQGYKVVAAMD
jgi:acetoin utilization protein AcuB